VREYLTALARRRDLILYLVTSGLKAQHRNTALGYFWWLLDPLLGALIYYVIVVVLFERGGPGYGAYLIVGLTVWRWLGSTIAGATRAIVGQAGIITQVYLPKIALPIATVLTGLASFGFGLIVLLLLLVTFFGIVPGPAFLWLPLVILSQLLFSLTLASIVAFACVFVRDIDTLVGHLMRIWFYGSPVIWTEAMLPDRFRWGLALNPIAHFLAAYRDVLIAQRSPDVTGLLLIALISTALLGGVLVLYSRHEHRIIKAL